MISTRSNQVEKPTEGSQWKARSEGDISIQLSTIPPQNETDGAGSVQVRGHRGRRGKGFRLDDNSDSTCASSDDGEEDDDDDYDDYRDDNRNDIDNLPGDGNVTIPLASLLLTASILRTIIYIFSLGAGGNEARGSRIVIVGRSRARSSVVMLRGIMADRGNGRGSTLRREACRVGQGGDGILA